MSAVWLILGVIAAYLLGTFPTAALVGRRLGSDPTCEGSRNPGASNVYRLGGAKAGLIVLSVDAAKGAVPVALALAVAGRPEAHAVWLAAVVGHVLPITRRLRGGKGVATAGGGGLVISPLIGLACVVVFVAVVAVTRVAALGSLAIATTFPIASAVAGRPGSEVAVAVILAAILVLRHRSNIGDLIGRRRAGIDP